MRLPPQRPRPRPRGLNWVGLGKKRLSPLTLCMSQDQQASPGASPASPGCWIGGLIFCCFLRCFPSIPIPGHRQPTNSPSVLHLRKWVVEANCWGFGDPLCLSCEEALVLRNSWSVSAIAMLTGQMSEPRVLRREQACTFRHGINALLFLFSCHCGTCLGRGGEARRSWRDVSRALGNGTELISWSLPFPQWLLIVGKMASP